MLHAHSRLPIRRKDKVAVPVRYAGKTDWHTAGRVGCRKLLTKILRPYCRQAGRQAGQGTLHLIIPSAVSLCAAALSGRLQVVEMKYAENVPSSSSFLFFFFPGGGPTAEEEAAGKK